MTEPHFLERDARKIEMIQNDRTPRLWLHANEFMAKHGVLPLADSGDFTWPFDAGCVWRREGVVTFEADNPEAFLRALKADLKQAGREAAFERAKAVRSAGPARRGRRRR